MFALNPALNHNFNSTSTGTGNNVYPQPPPFKVEILLVLVMMFHNFDVCSNSSEIFNSVHQPN